VVRLQRAQDTGLVQWPRIDASASTASVLSAAIDRVRGRLADVFNGLAAEIR